MNSSHQASAHQMAIKSFEEWMSVPFSYARAVFPGEPEHAQFHASAAERYAVSVSWADLGEFTAGIGGYGFITMNTRYAGAEPASVKHVYLHEFGHALGFQHGTSPVMTPRVDNLYATLTSLDRSLMCYFYSDSTERCLALVGLDVVSLFPRGVIDEPSPEFIWRATALRTNVSQTLSVRSLPTGKVVFTRTFPYRSNTSGTRVRLVPGDYVWDVSIAPEGDSIVAAKTDPARFTIRNPQAGAGVPLIMEPNGFVSTPQPKVTWTPVPSAVSYQLTLFAIASSGEGQSRRRHLTTSVSREPVQSVSVSADFSHYVVAVSAVDSYGIRSAWSPPSHFIFEPKDIPRQNTPPPVPLPQPRGNPANPTIPEGCVLDFYRSVEGAGMPLSFKLRNSGGSPVHYEISDWGKSFISAVFPSTGYIPGEGEVAVTIYPNRPVPPGSNLWNSRNDPESLLPEYYYQGSISVRSGGVTGTITHRIHFVTPFALSDYASQARNCD